MTSKLKNVDTFDGGLPAGSTLTRERYHEIMENKERHIEDYQIGDPRARRNISAQVNN